MGTPRPSWGAALQLVQLKNRFRVPKIEPHIHHLQQMHKSDNNGRLRIIVSDGVHSTSDTSDGTFTVGNSRPIVNILSPRASQPPHNGLMVDFVASATDVEDGDFDDDGTVDFSDYIVWTSNIDGELGKGWSISPSLSVGKHVVTVTVTDTDGASASSSVEIDVGSTIYLPNITR